MTVQQWIMILISCFGTAISIVGLARMFNKDSKDTACSTARQEAKLDSVANGINEIRLDQKMQGQKIDDINARLIRVEESSKSAHKRLDELQKEG